MPELKVLYAQQIRLKEDMSRVCAEMEKKADSDEFDGLNEEFKGLESQRKDNELTIAKELLLEQDEIGQRNGMLDQIEKKGETWRDDKGRECRVYSLGDKLATGPKLLKPADYIRAKAFGATNEIEERALDTTSGQTLVTEFNNQFIDKIRSESAVFRAGAKTIKIEGDSMKFSKLVADASSSWTTEAAAITPSDGTVETLSLTSEALLQIQKISTQSDQDSVNLFEVLYNSAVKSFAVKLDAAAFEGSGVSPIPEGIFNYTSVTDVAMGASDGHAKFSLVGYSRILEALYQLGAINEFNPNAIVMSPRSFRDLQDLADTTGQPLQMPSSIAALPIIQSGTGVISDARTVATATTECSTAYIGNFERLYFVSRMDFDMQVLRELYSANWQLGLLASLRGNFKPTHENAFVKLTGILGESSVLT